MFGYGILTLVACDLHILAGVTRVLFHSLELGSPPPVQTARPIRDGKFATPQSGAAA
jgi:hypothetical protein